MSTELLHQPETSKSQGSMSIATTRQAQEVQAAMVVAKRFPRDENESISRIVKSCKRTSLAEVAIYSYPKGGQKVEGASIRLAEAMAQSWGNIDFGWLEIETAEGESKIMAYAHDLETNTRRQQVFTVPHMRGTRKGNVLLTDPRDIYEVCANQASRRLRACILSVIPGDVQDLALAECERTLSGGNDTPIEDRVRQMLMAFKDKFSISKQMIETRVGYNIEAFTEHDLVSLRKVFNSIKDGVGKREDFFELAEKQPQADDGEGGKDDSKSINDSLKSKLGSGEDAATKQDKKSPEKKTDGSSSETQPVYEQRDGESPGDYHERLKAQIKKAASTDELNQAMQCAEVAKDQDQLNSMRFNDIIQKINERANELGQ